MRFEYQVIFEDFERELDLAGELAAATGPGSIFSAEARISLGNALTLLLASIFEEYVRQLLRAVWAERRKLLNTLDDFPKKLRAKLWRTGLEKAARRPFSDIEADTRQARAKIESLMEFCLENDLAADVEKDVSHNENNMRPGEITRLFNQIGVPDVLALTASKSPVLVFFGRPNPGQTNETLRERLEEFFTRRNIVAHEISFGSAGGPASISNDIDLFRIVAAGIAQAVDEFEAPASPVQTKSRIGTLVLRRVRRLFSARRT